MARSARLTFLHHADVTVGSGADLIIINGLIQAGLCCPRAAIINSYKFMIIYNVFELSIFEATVFL